MNKEDAIKFLQQIYPNGGHCWLDEQRIEAIGMAVKALQEEPEPKFNKGDKIQSVGKSTGHIYTFTIKEIQDDCYVLDDDKVLTFNMQDNWELVEEPVSEELKEAANDYATKEAAKDIGGDWTTVDILNAFKAGAKWQKEQFEKNRLTACDKQTEEEAEREQDFVMGIIENEHRQPTFDDAIKYGMRLQKEQVMAKAIDVTVHIDAGGYPYIPQMEPYDYDKDVPLAKEGDKYKVVLIKEE